MKNLIPVLALILSAATPASAQEGMVVDTTAVLVEAKAAVLAWLHQIDEGEYRASWDSSAVAFRGAVTPEQWDTALRQARGAIEKVELRFLTSATYMKDPPNAPQGEYVIHLFSAHAGDAAMIETVTVVRDVDGAWRAGGYYIRPE